MHFIVVDFYISFSILNINITRQPFKPKFAVGCSRNPFSAHLALVDMAESSGEVHGGRCKMENSSDKMESKEKEGQIFEVDKIIGKSKIKVRY